MVVHKDGDKSNNRVDNLEWISSSDNANNTAKKRSENGTTNAGKKICKSKCKKIVGVSNAEEKLHEDEKVVILNDTIYPYAISNSGKLRNLNTNQILKGHKQLNGYVLYQTSFRGKRFRCFAHRLVASMFLGMPDDECFYVDHINGIRDDNRLENLRWVSPSDNCKNIHAVGLYSNAGKQSYSLEEKEDEVW